MNNKTTKKLKENKKQRSPFKVPTSEVLPKHSTLTCPLHPHLHVIILGNFHLKKKDHECFPRPDASAFPEDSHDDLLHPRKG
jgi:hypothetical protein